MIELKSEGRWWFPQENIIQPGTLIFDENEQLLTISGPFLPTFGIYETRHKEDFIILGELADGTKITLVSHAGGNKQETIGQQYISSISEFLIKYVILGYHFQNVEDIKFESCLVEYSNLVNWIRFELDNKALSVRIDDERVFWTRYDKTIDLVIANSCSMQIFSSEKISFEQFTNKSEVSEKVYVRFDDLNKKGLEDCLDLIGIFNDFLNFAIQDDVKTISFDGVVKTGSEIYDTIIVQVLTRSSISAKFEKGSRNSCLFRFDEIKDQFNQIVNSWFKFKSELSVVYELYFGVMYNSELYLLNKFLMISEAIEVYHSKKFHNTDLTKGLRNLHDKIMPYIKKIPISNEISGEDIKKVKTWMGNGKRPPLSSRIMELYEKFSEILPYLSLKIGSKKCFAQKVSNYRNALTHGGISSKETDDKDLFWTYMDLHLLLRLCILSQLGFGIEKIHVFCHTEAPYNLKERMKYNLKNALEFFDPNTETAYSWSTKFIDRCDLPKSNTNEPDLLLKVIEGVQICIEKEREFDINEKKQKGSLITEDQLPNLPYTDLIQLGNGRKEKFFDNIFSANRQSLPNVTEKKEIIGISLALWSGCRSASKTLSKEENGGPKPEIRGSVFQTIEKLSSERPIFGKGVEVALLWKINQGQGDDVEFKEEVINPRIKKYEKLYHQRLGIC